MDLIGVLLLTISPDPSVKRKALEDMSGLLQNDHEGTIQQLANYVEEQDQVIRKLRSDVEEGPEKKKRKQPKIIEKSDEQDWYILDNNQRFEGETTDEMVGKKLPCNRSGACFRKMTTEQRKFLVSLLNCIARIICLADDSYFRQICGELFDDEGRYDKNDLEPILLELGRWICYRFLWNSEERERIEAHDRVMNDEKPKFFEEFLEAKSSKEKIEFFLLNLVDNLKTDRFGKTGTHYSRSVSIEIPGMNNSNHRVRVDGFICFTHVVYLLSCYCANPDNVKFIKHLKYEEDQLFSADFSRQMGNALEVVCNLLGESSDFLSFVSDFDAGFLGNFQFCDDNGDLIQKFNSANAIQIDSDVVFFKSLNAEPKFVVLVEAKGMAIKIANGLELRKSQGIVISLRGQSSLSLRIVLKRLSDLYPKLPFYFFSDLTIGGFVVFQILQCGHYGRKTRKRVTTGRYALKSRIKLVGMTPSQIKKNKDARLLKMRMDEDDKSKKNQDKIKFVKARCNGLKKAREAVDENDPLLEEIQILHDELYYIQAEQTGELPLTLIKEQLKKDQASN